MSFESCQRLTFDYFSATDKETPSIIVFGCLTEADDGESLDFKFIKSHIREKDLFSNKFTTDIPVKCFDNTIIKKVSPSIDQVQVSFF